MGAVFLGVSELSIDDDDAKKMAAAINDVRQYYDATFVEPKTMAWINLGIAFATVYGTRALAYNMRRKAEKRTSPQRVNPNTVSQMPSRPTIVTPPPATQTTTQQATRPVANVVTPSTPVRDFMSAGVNDGDDAMTMLG